MENQINTGEQNTQQVSQNSAVQSMQVSDRPKTNLTAVIVVAIVCSLVFGLGGYYLGKQSSQSQKYVSNGQNKVLPTTTPQANDPIPTINPSSTPDPTANWKTYTNTVYGYSIKYPKDWFAYDKGIEMTKGDFKDPKKMVLISQKEIDTVPEGDAYFSGAMVIFADIGKVDKANIDRNTFRVEETSLAGRQALKVYAIGKLIMGKPQTNYYVGEDYQDFSISFENTDFNGSHDKIFDQILSTFKFTK